MIRKIVDLAKKRLRKIPGFRGKTVHEVQLPVESEEKRVEEEALQPDKKAESNAAESKINKRAPKKPKWSIDNFQVTPVAGKSRFHDLDLPLQLMRGICDAGFQYCTPIQAKALPDALAGKDLIAQANTGTGKTAVFLITFLTSLIREKQQAKPKNAAPKALVLAPTRELVTQIAKDGRRLASHSSIRVVAVYGGVDYQKQIELLQQGRCDIVVATPGRLLDYLKKKIISLDDVQHFVLDEADRMLDMGFIPDVRNIVYKLPEKDKRHTMLFSATLSDDVKRLAYNWCRNPIKVELETEQVAVESVEQLTYMVTEEEKYTVLYNLIQQNSGKKMIVFVNQKNETRRLVDRLERNKVRCGMLTGDVPQKKRERRLEDFRLGRLKILIATDVAGRGIHVPDIDYVVNYTMPYEPEDFVHRIGRTGRAGSTGTAINFACEKGSFYVPEIEEYIGRKLPCSVPAEKLLLPPPKRSPQKQRQRKKQYRKPGPKKGGAKHAAKKTVGHQQGS